MTAQPVRILIAGFGPFPGAAHNPSGALVRRLARLRRPALANAQIAAHIFPTRYEAVERDLSELANAACPDVILMFGLASRKHHLRVETRARNLASSTPDAGGRKPKTRRIAAGPAAIALPGPQCIKLLRAARSRGLPAALSRDAGRYVCNYALWTALGMGGADNAAPAAAFVHIPKLLRPGTRRRAQARPSLERLLSTAQDILLALVAEARRRRR